MKKSKKVNKLSSKSIESLQKNKIKEMNKIKGGATGGGFTVGRVGTG